DQSPELPPPRQMPEVSVRSSLMITNPHAHNGDASRTPCPALPMTEFQTTDPGLAAFLVTRGHPLVQLTALLHQKPGCCFPPEARGDADRTFEEALVPARRFAATLNELWALAGRARSALAVS